ncbi:MAG TPA: hypothetical protein VEP66_21060 [Myxococcales bacterium]|nr:hypothetical protein [Myxococcales bacterium]
MIDVPARELKLIRNVSTHGSPPYFDPGNYAREITFNPGGSAITFTMIGNHGHWELRTLDLVSGAEQVLFPDRCAHHLYPSWSLDGHLAYYRNGPPQSGLFIDDQFVGGSPGGESPVAWIDSNSFIAFGIGGLQRVDLRSGSIMQMVSGAARFYDPAVDPGRSRLAYVRFDGPDVDGEEIWVAGIDGSNPTRVTHGGADFKPAWSPDGKSVLFVRFGAGLSLYDVASGSLTQVTRKPADAVAWAP